MASYRDRPCLDDGTGKYSSNSNRLDEFDFESFAASGPILLVGEGDFSFALGLAKSANAKYANQAASNITASVYEQKQELCSKSRSNYEKLERLGSKVLFGVDATRLESYFSNDSFNLIAFQFPYAKDGNTKNNSRLLQDFLKKSKLFLSKNGKIAVTFVDAPFYIGDSGMFAPDRAANYAEFNIEGKHKFYYFDTPFNTPFDTPFDKPFYKKTVNGYNHVSYSGGQNTLKKHRRRGFVTFVFAKA